MLRRLYARCLDAADSPRADWIMGAISFAESSVLPIPPDVMMIPMSLARPDKAWFYAALCTLTSVAGGLVGYLLGAALYDSLGHWFVELYGYGNNMEALREMFLRYGAWIILLKGLTPIPYKIVTITSGFAGYNLLPFLMLSIIARGMRFFSVAFLLKRYGASARAAIERRLELWFIAAVAVIAVGALAAFGCFW